MKKDYRLEKRKYVIGGLLIVLAVIYIFRLLELQVFETKYKENADSNAFLRKTVYPSRGQMFDRNGNLVVYNKPAYDVMIIPREIGDFDTLDLCSTLRISKEELRGYFEDMRNPRKNPGYSKECPGLPYLKEATFFRTRARCSRASARRRSVSEAFWS